MKPFQHATLPTLFSLAIASTGCQGGSDRQMVYTVTRGAIVKGDGVRVRAPFVNVRVPTTKPLPPSNGVDVPIVEPN